MPTVFVKRGGYLHGVKGYPLIREAVLRFIEANKPQKYNDYMRDVNSIIIEVYEKGKPYFKGLPIEFSLSHSDELWACVMDAQLCGIDIQKIRQCEYVKLSGRFYTASEHEYVTENGINAFFDIWTMKEAFGKLSGEGFFFAGMPDMIENGKLIRAAVFDGELYNFRMPDLQDGYKCAVCIKGGDEPGVVEI